MRSARPLESVPGDSVRPPSRSSRPIHTLDATGSTRALDDSMIDDYPMHSIPPSDARVNRRGPPRPRLETKQHYSTSPQYVTPTTSRHASPQSGSPYSSGRGSWGGQQPPPSSSYHSQQRYVLCLGCMLFCRWMAC
jgi:CTD kinase subunit alpha